MSELTSLPPAKKRKLLFSAGLSWLFDAMDVGLLSFIVAALAKEWHLGSEQIGLLTAMNSIGWYLGLLWQGFWQIVTADALY